MARRYAFRDEWLAPAPPEAVWALISDPTTFTQWWPIYREAAWVNQSDAPGASARLRFRVLLPYTITVVSTATAIDRPRSMEGTVDGELVGTWRWTLTPEGEATRVVFEEEVGANKRLLQLFAPVARRLFEMSHRIAAERGAHGMRAYLERMAG